MTRVTTVALTGIQADVVTRATAAREDLARHFVRHGHGIHGEPCECLFTVGELCGLIRMTGEAVGRRDAAAHALVGAGGRRLAYSFGRIGIGDVALFAADLELRVRGLLPVAYGAAAEMLGDM